MSTNKNVQDEFYSRTFSFRLSVNENGKKIMLNELKRFLEKNNLAFYELKAE